MDRTRNTIRLGERARDLLNDPVLTDAWAKTEMQIHSMWASTKSEQEAEREMLYRELHALRAVQARLKGLITSGKLAERQLEKQKRGN